MCRLMYGALLVGLFGTQADLLSIVSTQPTEGQQNYQDCTSTTLEYSLFRICVLTCLYVVWECVSGKRCSKFLA